MNRADFVEARRREAWAAGRALCDDLMFRYRQKYRKDVSPPPAKIVDELLTEFLALRSS